MDYYTKDGVKIEVGMEVEEKAIGTVVYIGKKDENICVQFGDCMAVFNPKNLTSIQKYNGYGLLPVTEHGILGANDKYTLDILTTKRQAFVRLITHHGCRPFVEGGDNCYMLFDERNGEVSWCSDMRLQSSPLLYDKRYPELEETFKQFLGV